MCFPRPLVLGQNTKVLYLVSDLYCACIKQIVAVAGRRPRRESRYMSHREVHVYMAGHFTRMLYVHVHCLYYVPIIILYTVFIQGMVGLRAYVYLLKKRHENAKAHDEDVEDIKYTITWWKDSLVKKIIIYTCTHCTYTFQIPILNL